MVVVHLYLKSRPVAKKHGQAAENDPGAVRTASPSQPLRRLQRLGVRDGLQHAVVRLLHVLIGHLGQLTNGDARLMNLLVRVG